MSHRADRLFLNRHPDPGSNVFLMMRFDPGPPRGEIRRIIQGAADGLGFDVVRADDDDYTGELWGNVRVCIEHCSLGIAVFDGVGQDGGSDFNVALELGYMLALNRPCLLLREQRLGAPPAMVANRLQTWFDSFDLGSTLGPATSAWLRMQRGHRTTSPAGIAELDDVLGRE